MRIIGLNQLSNWRPGPRYPHLALGEVHVWRISIDAEVPPGPYWTVLSPAEQARALRFHRPAQQAAYVLAHGAMRTILAAYERLLPVNLRFETAPLGKPTLERTAEGRLEFNLSHSGNLALLAVARDRAVGVDIERWNADMAHIDVAERYFSRVECDALRSFAGAPDRIVEGFFSVWSRKEAYLKATGHGVSHGLDHFDVSLTPGEPAALIADRKDADAPLRWTMVTLAAGAGYSAALVVAAPASEIALFDAPAPGAA